MNYLEYDNEYYISKELNKAYKRLSIALIVDALINRDELFINTELDAYIYCLDFPTDFYTELKKCEWDNWQGFINLYQYVNEDNCLKKSVYLKGINRTHIDIFLKNDLITRSVASYLINKLQLEKKETQRVWTTQEIETLATLWKSKVTYREIAQILNKTHQQVKKKIEKLRYSKTYSYLFI